MAELLALATGAIPLLGMVGIKTMLTEMNQVDIQRETHPFQCILAPSYGDQTSDAVQGMDEALKVCIHGMHKAVNKSNTDSWERLVACVMNNPMMEHDKASDIARVEKYTEKGVSWFSVDGSPDPGIVNEVEFWFKKLINDEDIIRGLRIDTKAVMEIVAQSGARIKSIQTLFYNTEYTERTVLDTGILRYPDLDHPYFKLYRIQLKAWSYCRRFVARQKDSNGITGDFKCIQFKPRDGVIAQIKPEIRAKAAAAAEELLLS